jgi:hypothetical protein
MQGRTNFADTPQPSRYSTPLGYVETGVEGDLLLRDSRCAVGAIRRLRCPKALVGVLYGGGRPSSFQDVGEPNDPRHHHRHGLSGTERRRLETGSPGHAGALGQGRLAALCSDLWQPLARTGRVRRRSDSVSYRGCYRRAGAIVGQSCSALARSSRRSSPPAGNFNARILRLIYAPAKPLPPLSAGLVAKFLNYATAHHSCDSHGPVRTWRPPTLAIVRELSAPMKAVEISGHN